jgi:hypothetical protein
MTANRGNQGRAGGWRFLLGAVSAVVLLTGLAEAYLRLFPPGDLHPYLGEQSPLTGPFVPDDDFAVGYRSWDAFAADNADGLRDFGPLDTSPTCQRGEEESLAGASGLCAGPLDASPGDRPVWAFFGNSFVQAPGMLGDTARARLRDHRIFYLGKNERPEVRLAQIKLLLEHGLEIEHLFLVVMPPDLLVLGDQPLATYRVTSRGAITYQPRLPAGPAGWLATHSRLALTAWCRTGLQRGNPHFSRSALSHDVHEPLLGDLRRLFGNLARLLAEHHVPATIILIPGYSQAVDGADCGFQDRLASLFRDQGYDVLDPRDAFRRFPHPADLYLPDRHLTPAGNRLLLDELLAHVRRPAAVAHLPREAQRP